MIYANVNLEIKDDIAKADRNIILYKGDKNVELRFIIHDNRFIVLNSTYAQLLIKRPSASPIFSDVAQIDGDTVVFLITKDMIDELQELGAYSFQIRLFDDNMEGRVTLPPCEECLIIREPLAEEVARVNDGMVNYSLLGHGEDYSDIFDETGDYIKTEWKDGDIITDDRLNKVEQALYGLTEGCARLSCYETTVLTIPKEVLQEALDNNVTAIECDSFVVDPTNILYAEFGGVEMTSVTVSTGYFEFFVANPTMDSGFAVVGQDGKDLVGDNPNKSKITLRVIKDMPITDLRFFQRDVNTISSIYLEHDMKVINSFSMNRRGAIGQFSTALGGSCVASGQYSVATGLASSATGAMSVALGRGCSATGTAGLSTGQSCIVAQEGFATGRQSQATGRAASSLGNFCMAKGTYSVAHGDNCQSNGSTSHAEGYYTIAGSPYQHVEGKYNVSDTKSVYAHIVGNGTSAARKNIYTLDWQGNGWFAGNVTIGADNKNLATEEYVNQAMANVDVTEQLTDYATKEYVSDEISGALQYTLQSEEWIFELADGTTVTKRVVIK